MGGGGGAPLLTRYGGGPGGGGGGGEGGGGGGGGGLLSLTAYTGRLRRKGFMLFQLTVVTKQHRTLKNKNST